MAKINKPLPPISTGATPQFFNAVNDNIIELDTKTDALETKASSISTNGQDADFKNLKKNGKTVLTVDDKDADTSWITFPLRSGINGTLRGRKIGKLVELHLHLTNPVTASVVQSGSGILTASVLPVAFRPTGTYRMNAFVDAAAGLSQEIAIEANGEIRVYVAGGWTTKAQMIGNILYYTN